MTAFSLTLNRRVRLLQPGGTDELGQPDPAGYTVLGKAWANIRNLKGVEALKAGALASQVNTSIRLRYRLDVTEGMQVEAGESTYIVRAVLPDEERRRHVDLVCEVKR